MPLPSVGLPFSPVASFPYLRTSCLACLYQTTLFPFFYHSFVVSYNFGPPLRPLNPVRALFSIYIFTHDHDHHHHMTSASASVFTAGDTLYLVCLSFLEYRAIYYCQRPPNVVSTTPESPHSVVLPYRHDLRATSPLYDSGRSSSFALQSSKPSTRPKPLITVARHDGEEQVVLMGSTQLYTTTKFPTVT